jgi:putative membrane protein
MQGPVHGMKRESWGKAGIFMAGHQSFAAAAVLVLAASSGCAYRASGTAVTDSASPGVSAADRAWLTTAHQANLAEVQAGELAEKKGATAAVRAAGRMLVADHNRLDGKVVAVARALGVSLPEAVAPDDAAAASRFADESGSVFDHDFTATLATGHQKVIAATQAEIREGSAPQVTRLARQSVPTLRKHLTTLQKASAAGG